MIEQMKCLSIPVNTIWNYLQNLMKEWDKLGDRKYEPANMQVYNHIRACQDDLEEWCKNEWNKEI